MFTLYVPIFIPDNIGGLHPLKNVPLILTHTSPGYQKHQWIWLHYHINFRSNSLSKYWKNNNEVKNIATDYCSCKFFTNSILFEIVLCLWGYINTLQKFSPILVICKDGNLMNWSILYYQNLFAYKIKIVFNLSSL